MAAMHLPEVAVLSALLIFLSSPAHVLSVRTSRRVLVSDGALEQPGCKTEETFSCIEQVEVECGKGVLCSASQVCDYEDKEACKDEGDNECTGTENLQCQAVTTECNSELSCEWTGECVQCEEGEDCIGGHICKPLEDVPKMCKSTPHFKCTTRNETITDPGYFKGWKYTWLGDDEWIKGDLCRDVECGDQEHCARARAMDCEVDPDFVKLARGGEECGSQTCDPGFVCTGEVAECKGVTTVCESKRNHFCVDQANTKHPGYIYEKAPSDSQECGQLVCQTGQCVKSTQTTCNGADFKVTSDDELALATTP